MLGLVCDDGGPYRVLDGPMSGVTGRNEAGEDLPMGRLVVLSGGVLRLATLPLSLAVVGITIARPAVWFWEIGDLVPVLRRGLVTAEISGNVTPGDKVHVLDGGLFAASGGELLPGAEFNIGRDGIIGVELNR